MHLAHQEKAHGPTQHAEALQLPMFQGPGPLKIMVSGTNCQLYKAFLQASEMPKGSIKRLLKVAAFALSPYSGCHADRTCKPLYSLPGETLEAVYPSKGVRYIGEAVCIAPLSEETRSKLRQALHQSAAADPEQRLDHCWAHGRPPLEACNRRPVQTANLGHQHGEFMHAFSVHCNPATRSKGGHAVHFCCRISFRTGSMS